MRICSLFAGIGGFDLAAEWMGWQTVVQVELDEWCRKVLAKNFPDAERYADIKDFNGLPFRGAIDLVCGGFPCQPYSLAGKRLGKADDRHLWPEMLRVIQEIQPAWVVGENVSGLLSWNEGLVFDEVLTDLENEGYQTQAFVLPACGVNAPHRRDRVWIVAHSNRHGYGREYGLGKTRCPSATCTSLPQEREWLWSNNWRVSPMRSSSHSNGPRLSKRDGSGGIESAHGTQQGRQSLGIHTADYWREWPAQPPLCTGNDGLSTGLVRFAAIKAAGNAVVPQLVYQIFKAIKTATQ